MRISYVKEGVFEKDEIMPRVSLQEVGLTIKETGAAERAFFR